MNFKSSYLYMITGNYDGKIELLIKTPTFIKITSLLTTEEQGIVGIFDINHILRLTILKYEECWSFALGKFNSQIQIPREWTINIQESYDNQCSTCLTLRTKSAVIIKPFTSIIIPEEPKMTEFEQFIKVLEKYSNKPIQSEVNLDTVLLATLDMDSLSIIECIMNFEEDYGINIDDSKIDYKSLTLGNLFELVNAHDD